MWMVISHQHGLVIAIEESLAGTVTDELTIGGTPALIEAPR
jgi:hypothetical protein